MIVTRFAPSPTGLLHLGHVFAALSARRATQGGRFLLRIEDIDGARCRPEFVDAILEDMAWLGLSWEQPVLHQSARFPAYCAALDRLRARGLLYPCFCTRKEIADEIARAGEAPHGPDGPIYPGTCRALSQEAREQRIASGIAYALRLDAAKAVARIGPMTFDEQGAGPADEHGTMECSAMPFGDVVLARKDMPASYHLAVVVDDAFQGVTLVTRGNDLFAATPIQRLLQALLDLPVPSYAHHRLLLDEKGRKFSKRDASVTLRSLRESSVTPEEVYAMLEAASVRDLRR